MWQPSLRHKVFHEVGHAQLNRHYGINLIKMTIDPQPSGWCAVYPQASTARTYVAEIGQHCAVGSLQGGQIQSPKPTREEFQNEIEILLAGEICGHWADGTPDDTATSIESWTTSIHGLDRESLETCTACEASTLFFSSDRDFASRYVKDRHACSALIVTTTWPKIERLSIDILGKINGSQANAILVVPGDYMYQFLD